MSCFEDAKLQLQALAWLLAQWEQAGGEAPKALERVVVMSRYGTERYDGGDLMFKARNAAALLGGGLEAHARTEAMVERFADAHEGVETLFLRNGNLMGCGPFAKVRPALLLGPARLNSPLLQSLCSARSLADVGACPLPAWPPPH